ncbi:MAG: flagella basal body P-ring formation protein FlgA [Alphaproteobacteria bacterium RIFOXYD12_FULL_60_8]|nr:MAG: flagella basal body P-ring formation protein FlgA [Alphaproteobacteria bacterium RIFOXYD12_FULL_60_8]
MKNMSIRSVFALVLPLAATLLAAPLPALSAEEDAPLVETPDLPPPPVNLKPSVEVDGAYVVLGDLFEGVTKYADKPVAYAPEPGKRTVFDARWLQSVARSYGVMWQPVGQYEKVTVTRASQVIDQAQIAQEIHAALADHNVGPSADVVFNTRNLQLYVPSKAEARVGVSNLSYDEHSGRFVADVEAPVGAPDAQRVRVSGRVYTTTSIPVFKRNIAKGETIKESDVELITLRESEVRDDTVGSAEDLIGKTPKKMVRAGTPVRDAEVERPLRIAKGALVTLVLQTPQMTLTTQGKAMENGAHGDTIRVQNVRSKTIVLGTVSDNNMVSVSQNAETPASALLTN